MTAATPMIEQYEALKAQYPDAFLFFRLGDFYELFGDDARTAARLLEITLTARDAGRSGRIPMCGVPHHAAASYIARLVRLGHKVAICEQLEDPKEAKGVVRRDVVRVVTPGTVLEDSLLDARENNYLIAVSRGRRPDEWGIAWADVSTGEFACGEIPTTDRLKSELGRLRPAEALLSEADGAAEWVSWVREQLGTRCQLLPASAFAPDWCAERLCGHFGIPDLSRFGCDPSHSGVWAAAALLDYVAETQKSALSHFTFLARPVLGGHMVLDPTARRNLELVRTLRDGTRRGSLLDVLDRTATAMGSRLLRRWLEAPLLDPAAIAARQDAVGALLADPLWRDELRELLTPLADLERLVARAACGTANARDLVALRASLQRLPAIRSALSRARDGRLAEIAREFDLLEDERERLEAALVDDPPISVREGGLIRPGYSAEVDACRQAHREGRRWIAALEESERERTGIKSLKIGFNKVFGYYIEITRPNLPDVPPEYERRQTLANAERFVTPELKEKEALILGAEERGAALEYALFVELREGVARAAGRIQATARLIAEIDVYHALARVADERGYCRPEVDTSETIEIVGGRHPVVEAVRTAEPFVPNSTRLGPSEQIIVLTGPNMAGKSTYLRQVALIVLMAQMGSWVPAERAHIGIVDRIFTRIGASDDLATGQSTFMVEMAEVANILHNATDRSLVILDEVGRGTSTFDGLSIAWAVVEYLHDTPARRAKTLFATHYHELTAVQASLPRVRNFCVAVAEQDGRVVFLRRIVPGGSDQSY
ncbi:MAG TPA: DNA mismatch repair protein MutS, partial [Limnochordia bacterium]